MGVKDKQLTAAPDDLLTEDAIEFICNAMTPDSTEQGSLRSLLESGPDSWAILDDPHIMFSLAESFVEDKFPRLGYYVVLRNALARAGISDEHTPMYMACLMDAAKGLRNPFLEETELAITIQSDRQKLKISSPAVKKRLLQKTAHLCTIVLILFRRSLNSDHTLNDGPSSEFYRKHAVDCYNQLALLWKEEEENELALACLYLSEYFDDITTAAFRALRVGLIALP
jgi:hypothetical protein